MLNSGNNNCATYIAEFSFHSFFKTSHGTQIFDLTLSDVVVGIKGNPKVTQKNVPLSDVCVPILEKQQNSNNITKIPLILI